MPAAIPEATAAPPVLVIDLAGGTVKTATWTRNGEAYSAVYVDLEFSDTYDLSLYKLTASGGSWRPVWAKSYGIGEDDPADRTWQNLLDEPAGFVPAALR